ncbi:MAG: hypothetical protein WEB06_15370 [Actinomycetota bacterium]
MLARPIKIVLSIAILGVLALPFGVAEGHGASAYAMQGGGNLTLTSGPGLGLTGPSTTSVYTFATLPIAGFGVLVGHPVAAMYNCPSSVTVTGVGLNIKINWTFTCNRTSGSGPQKITGSFAGKYPIFRGKFTSYINGVPHGTAKSVCTGAVVPTSVQGGKIKRMTFAGHCNSP